MKFVFIIYHHISYKIFWLENENNIFDKCWCVRTSVWNYHHQKCSKQNENKATDVKILTNNQEGHKRMNISI